jgi:hypothetical protein
MYINNRTLVAKRKTGKFIRRISDIFRPLHDLLRKDKPFDLKDKQKKMPFQIEIDASKFGIGCVLLQKGCDGFYHPIAYHSTSMLSAENNYPVQETQLLALLDCMEKWRHFVAEMPIQAFTDHQSLVNSKIFKNPTGRTVRLTPKTL